MFHPCPEVNGSLIKLPFTLWHKEYFVTLLIHGYIQFNSYYQRGTRNIPSQEPEGQSKNLHVKQPSSHKIRSNEIASPVNQWWRLIIVTSDVISI